MITSGVIIYEPNNSLNQFIDVLTITHNFNDNALIDKFTDNERT